MDQVAIGFDFTEMLEWTFVRGECLQDKIRRMAFFRMQDLHPNIDYQNFDVTLHGIECDLGQVEVVFNVKERV